MTIFTFQVSFTANMAETSGFIDYAVVKIDDSDKYAAREFMEAFEVIF